MHEAEALAASVVAHPSIHANMLAKHARELAGFDST
jgi:hypothetical protein